MIVKQADNLLRFFEHFASEQRSATLTQLSETLDLPVSSASNLIETLRARGYLFELRKRGGFYPTRRMFDISSAIVAGDPVLGLVRNHMEALRDLTGETVLLAARDVSDVIHLEALESPQAVRYSSKPGERRPVYAHSCGKAILAAQSDADLRRDLNGLDYSNAAKGSVTDLGRLFEVIVESRARGWFLNATEFTPEVSGVGVLLEVAGQKLGLSVAGPNYRMQGRHEELAAYLQETVRAIHAQVDSGGRA